MADGLSRRALIAGAAALAGTLAARGTAGAQALKEILIAEPVHQIGYIPIYMGQNLGAFAKRGLTVKTLVASGGAHVAALVSGQVWGNIGGPESDAMTNASGKADPLISICNCVNRANNYMMARKGLIPKGATDAQIAALLKGKKFALSRFGGTPDVLGRYYLEKLGLDLQKDVEIVNQADSAAAPLMVKQGAVDVAISSEPQITYGQEMGVWDEPFFSFPSLGEYTYSVISVRKSTATSDPATTQAFVDVMVDMLKIVNTSRSTVETVAKAEFPTLPPSGLKGALDRAHADKLWSADGNISKGGYELDMQVVAKSGEFNKAISYESVIDMTFVKKKNGGKA